MWNSYINTQHSYCQRDGLKLVCCERSVNDEWDAKCGLGDLVLLEGEAWEFFGLVVVIKGI